MLLAVGIVSLGMWLLMTGATQAAGAYRDVQLTVHNQGTRSVSVWMCDRAIHDASSCPEFNNHTLAPGKSAWRTHHTVYGMVNSYDHGPGWDATFRFRFEAVNPAVGKPYIRVYGLLPDCCLGTRPHYWDIGEHGSTEALHVSYFHIVLHRAGDTSRVKVMSITITKVPNS
ncbi:MAG: hypothetical protein ABI355_15765 [Solirubrobacteraceae bacterium]